jgi:ribosomal protein L19
VLEVRKPRDLDGSFLVRNTVLDFAYEMRFPIWSPFIRKVEVIQQGERVRRARLTYYRKLPLSDPRVRPID